MADTGHVIQSTVGRSSRVDPEAATAEALSAIAALGREPDLLLVYATSGYDHAQVLRALRARAPAAAISGCSAEGVITQGRADEVDHALAVMAVASDALRFDALLQRDYGDDSATAGRALAGQVRALGRPDPVALVVMPDGLVGDCTAFLDALAAALPPGLPIVGGAAADALRMERTQQFCDTVVASGAVAALLISGPAHAAVTVGHGCRPIGRTRTVTRAADGWIAELDHRPAWAVFREFLDGDPQDLRADGIMHLSVGHLRDDGAGTGSVEAVRTPLLLRAADGALFFPGGGIREGSRLRIVRRDPAQIRASALDTAAALLERGAGQRPALVLQFDCCGRGKQLFGTNAVTGLIDPVQGLIGHDVPWLGLHTYGEIGTVAGAPRYHNYSVVLMALFAGSP
jgi:hypothetical protein